jgi:hypothetical protein
MRCLVFILFVTAVGIVLAMVTVIYLLDVLVLRRKGARTAEEILGDEERAAERQSTMKDVAAMGDSLTEQARKLADSVSLWGQDPH